MKSYDKLVKRIASIYQDASKDGVKIDTEVSCKLVNDLLQKNRYSEADELYGAIDDESAYAKAMDIIVKKLWDKHDEKAINKMVSYNSLRNVYNNKVAKSFFTAVIGQDTNISMLEKHYGKLKRTFGDSVVNDLDDVTRNHVNAICNKSTGFENICDLMRDIKASGVPAISSMYFKMVDGKTSAIIDYAVQDFSNNKADGNISDVVATYQKYESWNISNDGKFISAFIHALSRKTFLNIDDMYLQTDRIKDYKGAISGEIRKYMDKSVISLTVKSFGDCQNIGQMNDAIGHIRESDLSEDVVAKISTSYISSAEGLMRNIDSIDGLNSEMAAVEQNAVMGPSIRLLYPIYTETVKGIFVNIDKFDYTIVKDEYSKIKWAYVQFGSEEKEIRQYYGISTLYRISKLLDEDIGSEVGGLFSELPDRIERFGFIPSLIKTFISAKTGSFEYPMLSQAMDNLGRYTYEYTIDECSVIDKFLGKTVRVTNIPYGDESVNSMLNYLSEKRQPYSMILKNINELMYDIEYFKFDEADKIIFNFGASSCKDEYSELIVLLSDYLDWYRNGGTIKKLLDSSDNVINTSSDMMDLCLAYAVAGAVNESDCSWPNAIRSYEKASKYDVYRKGYVDKCAEVSIKALNKDEALRYTGESNTVLSKLFAVEAEMITNNRVRNKISAVETNDDYTQSYKLYLSGATEMGLGVSDKALEYYTQGLSHIEQYDYSHARILKARLLLGHGRAQAILDKNRIYLSNADFERAIDLLSVYPETRRDIKMLIEEIERTKDKINNNTETEEVKVKKSSDSSLIKLIEIAGFQSILITGEPKGSGGRYKVYAGQGQNDSKQYAVRIHKDINPYRSATIPISGEVIKAMKKETELWELLTSECPDKVINLLGYDNTKFPVQVTEWADNSFDNAQSGLSTRDSRDIMVTVLYELQAIHDVGIVHNDIKPENILQIGKYWKISDFDTSFEEGENGDYSRGTYQYKSPEHFEGRKITSKSDIWAAGVMAYQVLTRTYPFDGGEMEYTDNVISGNYRTGPLEPKFRPLFERVFSVDPEKRPTAQEFADELKNLI